MSQLSRVVWSEGMYLGPHHFQAQNRYFEDCIQFTTNQVWFQPYGVLGCEFDAEALTNGTLALTHARGIFPDGLPFHMPEYDPLPVPRVITEVFPLTRDSVDVYLAVPAFHPDGLNCALNGADPNADIRYRAEQTDIADQNTGLDAKPVQIGRKNIRVLLEPEAGEGLTKMAVARIRRQGTGNFVFDDSLVPPCLQIGVSKKLMLMQRRLLDALAEKCRALARPRDLASSASGFSAEGIANAWFLHCINSSVGPLTHLYESRRAHPERLFAELSRLAGALCTFSLESHPADLPLYDHTRLAECFDALDRHIRAHLELVVPSNRVEIPLARTAPFFWAGPVADQRTLHQSRWILGIRTKIGESEIIESTPRLVKVCSQSFVPKLVERALPGMKLSHLQVPPPALSPRIDFQYFAIDKAGPCWEHIIKTREVGVYVPGELPEPDLELSVILET